MENITFILDKLVRSSKILSALLLMCFLQHSQAQVYQNGTLFIDDNTYMYLESGAFIFGPSPTATSSSTRTVDEYGKLIFESGVTFSGATTSHFFDGYVSTLSSSSFIAPIGDVTGSNKFYLPAKLIASSTAGVDAAFYNADPTTVNSGVVDPPPPGLDTGIIALYDTGYWHILRSASSTANATISLSWSSTITSLIGSDLNALSIVAFDSDSSLWVVIPSTVDAGTTSFAIAESSSPTLVASTITSGSITTDAVVDLSKYKFFTLANLETCAPIVDDNGITTTWDGSSWNPVTPTEEHLAVLGADYSAGSFIANSLNLGAFNVTLANGDVLDVVKSITGTGKVILAEKASLIQRDAAATAPQIEMLVKTRELSRYDYTYFGSPVQEPVFSQLQNAYYLDSSDKNRLYNHYKLISGDESLFGEELAIPNPYLTPWQKLTSSNFVAPGYGWISSIASKAPFLPTNNIEFKGIVSLELSGTANNGNIVVNVLKSGNADPIHGSHSNLLANPYPSAINANKFLEENLNIDGVVYIWQASTAPLYKQDKSGLGSYNASDYITYTKAGSTIPNVDANVFNGFIAPGQGFVVQATTAGTVQFNNCMRTIDAANNAVFFKSNSKSKTTSVAQEESYDSYKLNLNSGDSNQYFSQILLYYKDGLTLGYDRMYDALNNSNSDVQLFSFSGLDTDNAKLAINARPSFDAQDIVPLGLENTTGEELEFTVSISDKVGVFANNNTDIFIYDSLLDTYHNLSNPYTFTNYNVSIDDRFKIVYKDKSLNNEDFNVTSTQAFIINSKLKVKSDATFDTVVVYDVTGRLINVYKDLNTTSFETDFSYSQGVYILNVYSKESNSVSNFKLINK